MRDAGNGTIPAGSESLPGDVVSATMLPSTFFIAAAREAACGAVDTAA